MAGPQREYPAINRRAGIDGRLACHGDMDRDAFVPVDVDAKNLERLVRWLGAWPKALVPEAA